MPRSTLKSSLVITSLLAALGNGCGSAPAWLRGGGISSGGAKPKPEGGNPDTAKPAPAPAPAPAASGAFNCPGGPDLTGTTYTGGGAAADCSSATALDRPACLIEMRFVATRTVDEGYAEGAGLNPLVRETSFDQCGDDLHVTTSKESGVVELHELKLQDGGKTLLQVETGRVYTRQ